MPKVRPTTDVVTTGAHEGCLVRGRWMRADGTPAANQTVRFEPKRGGIWQGQAIGRDPFTVQTDADGRFALALVPSSVVGQYTVRISKAIWVIEVPETTDAEFWEIVM